MKKLLILAISCMAFSAATLAAPQVKDAKAKAPKTEQCCKKGDKACAQCPSAAKADKAKPCCKACKSATCKKGACKGCKCGAKGKKGQCPAGKKCAAAPKAAKTK
jgi:hypothetical protein